MSNDDEETAAQADEEVADVEPEEGDDEPSDSVQEEDTPEDEAAEEEESGLAPGDVIRLAYTAYASESEQLVDTTDPEVAEAEGIDDEQQTFEPRVVVLGEGHLFDAVEEALFGQEAGVSGEVVVPSEEAFGEVDPEQVRTVSADKIPEDDRYPGAHVDIDGQHGFIETIIGGRARVDFNHPLAGEDIEYEYEVLDVLEDRTELAAGLLRTFLDVELDVWFQTDEVEVETEDDDDDAEVESLESLYIEATPALAMNQQWLFRKQDIAGQLIDQVGVDRVVVQEILESREKVLEETQELLADEGIEDVEELLEE